MLTVMNAYRNTRPDPQGSRRRRELLGAGTARYSVFELLLCKDLFVRGWRLRGLGNVSTVQLGLGSAQLTSNFVAPANIFWNPIPTPSMTASRMAQLMAPFLAAL